MNRGTYQNIAQKALSLLGVLFGVLTIVAGSSVLRGANPGYVVFLPLLIYNTIMGFVYVGVGTVAWRNLNLGKNGSGTIFVLNAIVLGATGITYMFGGEIAIESLRAMALRTVVWLVFFAGLWWISRSNINTDRNA